MNRRLLPSLSRIVRPIWIIPCCLLTITVLGGALRTVDVADNPPGFFADEAVVGVDAYAILTTGREHHGKIPGLFFEALGNDVGFVATWAAIPWVKLLGLSEQTLRLVTGAFGTLTIPLLFNVTALWFGTQAGLFAGLFLALSPWHIQMSRMGNEYVYFPFLFLIGVWLFYRGLKRHAYLPLSLVVFGITMYTYYPARLLVPLSVLLLLFLYRKNLITRQTWLTTIIGSLCFGGLLMPLLIELFSGKFARWNDVSVFGLGLPPVETAFRIIHTYLNYFSPTFLFFRGDAGFPGQMITRHSIIGVGELYASQLLFVLIGLLWILMRPKEKTHQVIVTLLLIYPLGGALTSSLNPNATRGILGSIVLQVVSGVGLTVFFRFVKAHTPRLMIPVSFVLIIIGLLMTAHYVKSWRAYRMNAAGYLGWQFGPKEIMAYFVAHKNEYDELYMTGEFNAPHILMRFYDPDNQCEGKCLWGDPDRFDRGKNQLFAIRSEKLNDYLERFRMVHTVSYPDGSPAFYIGTIIGD